MAGPGRAAAADGRGPLGNEGCEIWRGNNIYGNNNANVPGNSTK
jgi:hypothetical protein